MALRMAALLNRHHGPMGLWAVCIAACAGFLQLSTVRAAGQDGSPAPPLSEPARTWAVDAANNEVRLVQHPDSYLGTGITLSTKKAIRHATRLRHQRVAS